MSLCLFPLDRLLESNKWICFQDNAACRYNAAFRGASVTGFTYVSANEAALQTAVANVGPIAVAIDASKRSFQLYKSGLDNLLTPK